MTAVERKKKAPSTGLEHEEAEGPYRVRLPSFVTDEEIGLGDVMTRATHWVGVRPCSGCRRRAAALNRWLVFTR
jgi:hypothetical protein